METTLERYLRTEYQIKDNFYPLEGYYKILERIVPRINSLTEYNFRRPKIKEVDLEFYSLSDIELLCFARHLGFPSPLLDWTYSYYVAAFFAFRDVNSYNVPSNKVAIYAYQESTGEGRVAMLKMPV